MCKCPPNLSGVACSVPIESLTLKDTVIERHGRPLFVSENITDVRVLPEGAFDIYRFRIPKDTAIVRATLDHALHHGSSPRLFLRRNAVPIHCPPGLRGGILSDSAGEVNGGDGICRDAYDASDTLETREESSSGIPESKVIPNETRDDDDNDVTNNNSFDKNERYLVQHEASVKVSDVPRRYNMSSSIGAAAEKEDDDGDWWFLSVFNDPIGASE